MRSQLVIIALLLVAAAPAEADDRDEIEPIEVLDEIEEVDVRWDASQWPRSERAVSVMTARTTRAHTLLTIIDHRTGAPLIEEPFHDLLGFDSGGLRIGLGLRYGITDRLDVGLYRLNQGYERFDTWDIDLKAQLLQQHDQLVDLALRGGLTWFSAGDTRDELGGFGQLLVSRVLFARLTLGSGLLYHSHSQNEKKLATDVPWSLAVPLVVELRLTPSVVWASEATFTVAGYGSSHPAVSTALRLMTYRHAFSIVVGNTQQLGAAGLPTNSYRGLAETIIGFTITREIALDSGD